MLQPALDFLDNLGVCLFHVGHALDHLDLLLAGQSHEDLAGLLRRKVGEDQRDGLRMLILDERQQVLAFGPLQECKRRRGNLLGHLFYDPFRILFREALL